MADSGLKNWDYKIILLYSLAALFIFTFLNWYVLSKIFFTGTYQELALNYSGFILVVTFPTIIVGTLFIKRGFLLAILTEALTAAVTSIAVAFIFIGYYSHHCSDSCGMELFYLPFMLAIGAYSIFIDSILTTILWFIFKRRKLL